MERGPNIVLTSDESEPLLVTDVGEAIGASHPSDFWLVGKVVTQHSFNTRAFKTTLAQVWKVKHGVEIREVGRNLFTFRFFDERDRSWVLKQGPWNFDRFLIAIQIFDPQENPSEVSLERVPFWIRVHDLPLALRTEAVAKSIGESLGGFLAWDRNEENRLGSFLRFRAQIKVTCPLRRGTVIARPGRYPVKVWFQYERLGNFCYACGNLDHVLKDCADFDGDEEEEDLQTLPYGHWIRAPPLRANVVLGVRGEVSRSGVICSDLQGGAQGKGLANTNGEVRVGGREEPEVLVDALVSNLAKVNVHQGGENNSELNGAPMVKDGRGQPSISDKEVELSHHASQAEIVKPKVIVNGNGNTNVQPNVGGMAKVADSGLLPSDSQVEEGQNTERLCFLIGPEETIVLGGAGGSKGTAKSSGKKWKKIAREQKPCPSISTSVGETKRKNRSVNDPMAVDSSSDDVPLKKFCDMLTVEAGDQPRRQP